MFASPVILTIIYRAVVQMKTFIVDGLPPEDKSKPPVMVSMDAPDAPKRTEAKPLLDVQFETNPPDGKCDQRVIVRTQSINVIYDAVCFLKFYDFFVLSLSETVVIDRICTFLGCIFHLLVFFSGNDKQDSGSVQTSRIRCSEAVSLIPKRDLLHYGDAHTIIFVRIYVMLI